MFLFEHVKSRKHFNDLCTQSELRTNFYAGKSHKTYSKSYFYSISVIEF